MDDIEPTFDEPLHQSTALLDSEPSLHILVGADPQAQDKILTDTLPGSLQDLSDDSPAILGTATVSIASAILER
jgi:hypothetical protein